MRAQREHAEFDQRADRMERLPDGNYRLGPLTTPTDADRADHREIRAALADRPAHEIRALYLQAVADGNTTITTALEQDPARALRAESWLDPLTIRRAREIRLQRNGLAESLARSARKAQVLDGFSRTISRELGVPMPVAAQ